MYQYLDLIKILNSLTSIITTLAGDYEELECYEFSVKMKDVDNRIFTFSSACLLNNNVRRQKKHIFQNCKGGSCNMQDDKYTWIIKDAEEGTKLRTVQAKLKDELIRVHLHNDNHDESKEQSCLRHCSCNRVHQTAKLTYEKHKSMLFLLVTSVQSKFRLPSHIDGIKSFSYIKVV
jgi:hypothetical protein